LKTGTVEIQQHVATTPTVSKSFPIGTILVEEWTMETVKSTQGKSGSFVVLGKHKALKFIGDEYVSISALKDYTANSHEIVVDEPKLVSYLRERAQKVLGGVIQEIEEGVFDD